MKAEDILDSLNEIDDEIIDDVDKKRKKNKERKKILNFDNFIKIGALAACLLLIIFIGNDRLVIFDEKSTNDLALENEEAFFDESINENIKTDYALALANYPIERVHRDSTFEYSNGLIEFTKDSTKIVLSDSNGENKIYSPINAYISLGILSQISDGESRDQLQTLLHEDNQEKIMENISDLWLNNYYDDEFNSLEMNNSLWLRNDQEYNMETVNLLKDFYYTSVFAGDMEDQAYLQTMRDWINDSSKNLLENQVKDMEFSKDNVISILSSIYYSNSWSQAFEEENNSQDIFYLDDGNEINLEYMNKKYKNSYIKEGDYETAFMGLNRGTIQFVLPNQGIDIDQVLKSSEFNNRIEKSSSIASLSEYEIDISLPKFNISSNLSLIDTLKKLGVKDIFDENLSDFSPIIDHKENSPMKVTKIDQTISTSIDEDGFTGVGLTQIDISVSDQEEQEENYKRSLVLNRPFIFIVYSEDYSPIFIGIVNNPIAN